MNKPHQLGKEGEELAVKFLEKNGYLILDRNVSLRRGELDIVAREGGDIVFIEVKTRSGDEFGSPAEAVNEEKARKIAAGAREYIYQNLLTEENTRCDVLAITAPPSGDHKVELFKCALDLGDYS
ncbi:MAG: YraN family protein [Planctomycetes bacterium]|nr:YraN family protein [Planctomycetota bacterium]